MYWQVGYRHFDTASLYRSECALGDALKEAFLKGLVAREEVFVTTKLWCEDLDDPVSALKTSLKSVHLAPFLNLFIYKCFFFKEVGYTFGYDDAIVVRYLFHQNYPKSHLS